MIKISRFGETHLPPLVLLHGFLGAKEDWLELMPHLSQQFHCVCIDLPGHGQSRFPLPTPGFDAVCQGIIACLDSIKCQQFHLLGYSLGGRIALHIAQHYPQRLLSLTLESAHHGLNNAADKQARLKADAHWQQKLTELPIKPFLQQWYQQAVFADLTPEQKHTLINKRSANQPSELLNCYAATSLGYQNDLTLVPNQLNCPCHILVGQHDSKFLALAQQWQQDADIKLITIAHAGHNIHSLLPQVFCQQVLQQCLA